MASGARGMASTSLAIPAGAETAHTVENGYCDKKITSMLSGHCNLYNNVHKRTYKYIFMCFVNNLRKTLVKIMNADVTQITKVSAQVKQVDGATNTLSF